MVSLLYEGQIDFTITCRVSSRGSGCSVEPPPLCGHIFSHAGVGRTQQIEAQALPLSRAGQDCRFYEDSTRSRSWFHFDSGHPKDTRSSEGSRIQNAALAGALFIRWLSSMWRLKKWQRGAVESFARGCFCVSGHCKCCHGRSQDLARVCK